MDELPNFPFKVDPSSGGFTIVFDEESFTFEQKIIIRLSKRTIPYKEIRDISLIFAGGPLFSYRLLLMVKGVGSLRYQPFWFSFAVFSQAQAHLILETLMKMCPNASTNENVHRYLRGERVDYLWPDQS